VSPLEFFTGVIAVAAALSAVMTVAFLIQQRTGNSGWIDTTWTFGLGLVMLAAALPIDGGGWHTRQVIVAVFAVVWASRLGGHIAGRSASIKDDPRYAQLIKNWGTDARRQMFWLCQKQALVSIPMGFAAFVAAHNPVPAFRVQDWLAIAVMAIALGGEALADHQLRIFKRGRANKGKINQIGLWSWSRHPNYFFEWLGWLAFPLLAIDLNGAYPWGYAALAAPACMYWLLNYVSGIPPLEQHMLETRGDAFRSYQRRTNAFFPAPPHRVETR
jgi:steroid 5-alpha reductase family enzyme